MSSLIHFVGSCIQTNCRRFLEGGTTSESVCALSLKGARLEHFQEGGPPLHGIGDSPLCFMGV